jgi:hypothetical protein
MTTEAGAPIAALRAAVVAMIRLVDGTRDESTPLGAGRSLLRDMVADLRRRPDACTRARQDRHQTPPLRARSTNHRRRLA